MKIAQEISKVIEGLYNILDYLKEQEERQKEIKIVDFRSYQEQKEIEEMLQTSKGSLRTRPNGTYEYRYYQNGKQYSVYAKTKAELIKKARADKRKEKAEPQKAIGPVLSFSEWATTWIKVYKRPKLKDGSVKQIESKLKAHVLPFFGDKPLSDISAEDLQQFFNALESSRTEKYIYSILSQIFNKAVEIKKISSSPLVGIVRTKYRSKPSNYLTDEEISELLFKTEGKEINRLFRFYLLTGARRNEALAVRREDVNFKDRVLHIPGTKTDNAERYVPISDELYSLLWEIRERDQLFKFCPEDVSRAFHAILPNHHLHELRHTFASKCLAGGIDAKVIQLWLGHASIQTTLNVYAKVNKELSAKSVAKLNNLPIFLPLKKDEE